MPTQAWTNQNAADLKSWLNSPMGIAFLRELAAMVPAVRMTEGKYDRDELHDKFLLKQGAEDLIQGIARLLTVSQPVDLGERPFYQPETESRI